jgi:hypothetical protein
MLFCAFRGQKNAFVYLSPARLFGGRSAGHDRPYGARLRGREPAGVGIDSCARSSISGLVRKRTPIQRTDASAKTAGVAE